MEEWRGLGSCGVAHLTLKTILNQAGKMKSGDATINKASPVDVESLGGCGTDGVIARRRGRSIMTSLFWSRFLLFVVGFFVGCLAIVATVCVQFIIIGNVSTAAKVKAAKAPQHFLSSDKRSGRTNENSGGERLNRSVLFCIHKNKNTPCTPHHSKKPLKLALLLLMYLRRHPADRLW